MKFNLGKSRSFFDKPTESEVLERWRAAGENRVDSQEEFSPRLDTEHTEETESLTVEPKRRVRLQDEVEVARTSPPLMSDHGVNIPRTIAGDLSQEDELSRRFGSDLKAVLGPGTVINGKLSFDSPVRIDGTLSGEVSAASALIVGEQGLVEADLTVGTLVVVGRVSGEVQAQDLVEIKAGGRIEGDIRCKRIIIEEGGLFDGACTMKLG